ncbi:MAG: ATP-dependent helicase [Eubacteriales bacterium]|nr:ATP-dependent helicase [Eubacteriales bacterium]
MALNPAQQRAVHHTEGPMLVLAGPGSGKTTVIVGRIRYLTKEYGISPEKILVITFTKAAALEMQERYEKETGRGNGLLPVFGTFHSVFFSILRDRCGFTAKSIVSLREQQQILKKILDRTELPLIYTDDLAEVLLARISRTKNAGGLSSAAGGQGEGSGCAEDALPEALFAYIYQEYERMMRFMNRLDFDDMLLRCLLLLRTEKEVLAEERKRFRYVLVDEFQDINSIQYEILKLLCVEHRNLFIVGDDDQSIYGFRGSEPEIMLGFPRDYPGCRTVLLGTNYRSGKQIVDRAQKLIRHNKKRFRKELQAGRDLLSSVSIESSETEAEETALLIKYLREYRAGGLAWSEMAVLCRTGAGFAQLLKALRDADIPAGGKKQEEGCADRVMLSTFHGSKGLEFTAVFIMDANEGITPHRKAAADEKTLSEERRMFYVAVTRAKQFLHILHTKSRYNKIQNISRFVLEMTEEKKTLYGRVKGIGGR